jgi:hypothetical protein
MMAVGINKTSKISKLTEKFNPIIIGQFHEIGT